MDRLEEIRARAEAATPGPWMWNVNEHCQNMKLVTTHSGQYYVMGFERWGMQGAQPTFQVYRKYSGPVKERESVGMKKAIALSKWNQDYRHNDGWVDHPDAEFIANSREDVTYLLGEIDRLTTEPTALREANRWIPVEERLPATFKNELGEPVEFNVMLPSATEATTLCFDGFQWFEMNWTGMKAGSYYSVTHWRPLPEPPKEG